MSKKENYKFIKYLSLFLFFIFTACYQNSSYDPITTGSRYDLERKDRVVSGRLAGDDTSSLTVSQSLTQKMPWEIWTDGRDLGGQPIAITEVLKGDALINEGQRARALEEYRRIKLGTLTENQRAAVVYRIASTELALDRPKKALSVLGWFVEKGNLKVDQIDPFTGLLLGYAYGRDKDYNQSFAWFSRINRMDAGQGGVSDAAKSAAGLLARTILDNNFQQITNEWSNDIFVHQILGQEKMRRAKSGITVTAESNMPFWQKQDLNVEAVKYQPDSSKPRKVIVLLPLTGQYGSLGQSTKRGIELAFRGSGLDRNFTVEYKDTYGDRAQAAAILEQAALTNQQVVVLGPLLAPEAEIVAEIGRKKEIPVLALTKSHTFRTGDNIFRLGPTTESVIDSLLEAAYNNKGIREFGFVYPDEPQSKELIETARNKLLALGLAPMYEASYLPGNYESFATIVKQLEVQPVEAILMTDNILAATRFRTQMNEGLRHNITLLGTAKWDVPDELRQSARALEGSMFVSPFFVFDDNIYNKQFQNTYKATFNAPPDFLAAQGFDAATLLSTALKQSNQSGDYVSAFKSIDLYQGLTGEISVSNNGELERKFKVVELGPVGLQAVTNVQRPIITDSGLTQRGQYE